MSIYRITAFLFLLLFSVGASASDRLSGPVDAYVTGIVDGDTLRVRALVWLDQTVAVSVRLRGIDTPERNAPCALERDLAEKARARLEKLVFAGPSGGMVRLRQISRDKYGGRVVAYVDNSAGVSVGDVLLTEKIAQPYRGRHAKPVWCKTARP